MNSSPRGGVAWLVGLNLVLAAALAVLWLLPGAPAQWRHWRAPAPQAPTLDDIHAALLEANPAATAAYPALLERPLMSPTRRAPVASAPESAASAPPPTAIEKLKLLGIVAGPALDGVMIEQEGKTSFVRRGERVGDWTLDALMDREASFVRGGERRRVELPIAHAAPDAPAARPSTIGAARAARSAPAPSVAPPAVAAPVVTPPAAAATPAASAAPPSKPTGSFGGRAKRPSPTP